ncbi:MAG: hypothetical protein ABEJ83_04315 [Candidatus Nanohaloarchaea archaeon]
MKKLVAVVSTLLLAGSVAGVVKYEIESGYEQVEVNATVQLECRETCPVSYWRLNWQKPEDAEIVNIEDSQGRITDYSVNGSKISIETNRGAARKTEIVEIDYVIHRDPEKVYKGLFRRKISLPSFKNRTTYGEVNVTDLISGSVGKGFQTSFSEESFRFKGEGPVNIRFHFGEGYETKNYEFFGVENVSGAGEAYRIASGTTGLSKQFQRFPVAVMGDQAYEKTSSDWSAGEYIRGSIRMRKGLNNSFLPVLAHETVHGLNERVMYWDNTNSSYFDEGTANYVEFLLRKKLYRQGKIKAGPPELFGETSRFRSRDKSDLVYTVAPESGFNDLWSYYRENRSFMKWWSPLQSSHREFGYAYAQLIVRNHIANNRSLWKVYRSFNSMPSVSSNERKWRLLSRRMDLKPCDRESKEAMRACLENVNIYDYPIYLSVVNGSEGTVKQIELPDKANFAINSSSGSAFSQAVDRGAGFFQNLIALIESILG